MSVDVVSQRGAVRIADLAWHRNQPAREAAAERYERMLLEERGDDSYPTSFVHDQHLADFLELTKREVRFLMENGLPHVKWTRTRWVTKPDTAATWIREFAPTFMPIAQKRAPIPRDVRAAVLDRDGHRCRECGGIDDLAMDHIQPWSRFGSDGAENLQTLCRSCNSKKRDQ